MKRLLSVLMILTIILSFIPSIYAQENITDDMFEKNIGLIKVLGADVSDSVQAEDCITRADFVKYTMQMYGRNLINMSAGNYYKDVLDGETDGAKEINAATAMGIINGKGDSYFHPESTITYVEAYKIVCEVLGYNAFAISQGGYSKGYQSLADSIGLTKGIKASVGAMSYEDALRLICNMLSSNITKFDIINKEVSLSEKTFLEHYRNIITVKGRVTANDITGLYDNTDAGYENIIINGHTYGVGKTNASMYLGYEINAYIDAETNEAIYLSKTGTDTVVEFSGINIEGFEDGALIYTESGNEKKLKLPDITPIIYNMSFLGNVKNIDVNTYINDAYNVSVITARSGEKFLFISKYNTIVVDSVNEKYGMIYARYGNTYQIPDDADLDIRFLGDDKEATLASITKWNVLEILAVSTASGKQRVYITIVDYPFKGYLRGTSANGSNKVWIIDGTEYIVSQSLLNSGAVLPQIGQKAVYYVDSLSRITAVDYESKTNYAYFIRAYIDEDDEQVYVKLYNSNGEHVTLQCKEKLKCDTTTNVSSQLVLNLTPKQLVMFETNNKDMITEIYTANNKIQTDGSFGWDFDKFSLDYKVQGSSAYVWRVYLRQESAYASNVLGINNETVIFDIPKNMSDTKKFKISSYTDLGAEGSLPSGAKVYDIDKFGNASIVLIERAASTITGTGNEGQMNIIKSVTEILSEDDEVCYEFILHDIKEPVLAKVDELEYDSNDNTASDPKDVRYGYGTINVSDLQEGDVIQYITDNEGKMLSYRVVFRPSNPAGMTYRGGLTSSYWLGYGRVQASDSGVFSTVDTNGKLRNFSFNASLAKSVRKEGNNVWIYDSRTKTMDQGTFDDVRVEDKVFTRVHYGILSFVMIVR